MKKKVCAYLHTHWDREWYRDKEDFNIRFLDVFDVVLDELKKENAPFFYLDGQVVALLDYLKYREEKKEEIIELIKKKKLAIGPYFVSADSYLTNFSCMLKNIDLGLKYSKIFGQKEYIGYLSDIFGISNSAFEALKLKKINKALIWRGVNENKLKNNCNFIKNQIKTTWLVKGYFNDFFNQEPVNIAGIEKFLTDISSMSPECCLLPIGADHLGMLKNAKQKIKEVNQKLKNYEIILTSPFEYFKQVEHRNIFKEKEFLDNNNTYILSGVYSARIPQKIKNNEIQNHLSRIVEPLNFYLKEKYSNNIEHIYETLIKNHAHDGIYGCSIDSVHRAIDFRLEKCENTLNSILKAIKYNFKKKYKIQGKTSTEIGLFNLSNIDNLKKIQIKLPYVLENSQIIKKEQAFCDELLGDIYKIPVTEDITTLYTQLVEVSCNNKFEYNVVKIKKPIKKTVVSDSSIENDNIKLEIKNKKIIILNKKTKEQFNLKITDIKDIGDSYNFAPCGKYNIFEIKSSKILYDDKIQSALRINFNNIKLDAILDNHSEFIRFSVEIKNNKKNHKIQLVLELNEKIEKTIAQDAIGIINRKIDSDYNMFDFMPAKRPIELKSNAYPMQNFVLANSVGVITKGLNEYEIFKNELRICLLRCFSTISNPKNPARSIPAGPDLKTFDSQEIKNIKSEIILFFGNERKAFQYLDEIFDNYIAIDGNFKTKINLKFAEIPDDSYVYGINNGKKILYNIKNKNISLI